MWRFLARLIKWSLILGALFAVFLLVSAPFYVYSRFNAEQPVAEIWFERLGDKKYLAHVASGDLCTFQSFVLLGDQWQLDAAFLKWKGWAAMLGLDSLYRLDRLSGRYADITEQNTREHRSYDIAPEVFINLFPPGRDSLIGGGLVDTIYGSSVYLDIDTAKKYRVFKTEDALIARALDRSAMRSQEGTTTVIIDKACGEKEGWVARLSRCINAFALEYLRGWAARELPDTQPTAPL